MDHQLATRATALRLVFGLVATLAGLDKFFNVLADWGDYISPQAAQLLPVSPDAFMHLVGIIELAVGISILGAAPVLGAYVASAWLLLVAGNLLLGGHLDIAVRDVVMSMAAFTLARLIELRSNVASPAALADSRQHVIA
jgi:uncharacterized membrane protein YphA (DoxX/SURF4 family)